MRFRRGCGWLMVLVVGCLGGDPVAEPGDVARKPAQLADGQGGAAPGLPSGAGPSGPAQPVAGGPGSDGNGAAETLARGELPILPPELRARLDEGLAKVKANDYDAALIVFSAIIADYPEGFDAYDHRSMIYYNRQQYAEVAADCTRAIDIARANGTFAITCPERCLTRRGASYLNLEKWDLALVDFNEVLQFKQSDGFTYFERGRALFGLGRMDEARADLNKALELAPEHPVVSEIAPHILHKIADPDFH